MKRPWKYLLVAVSPVLMQGCGGAGNTSATNDSQDSVTTTVVTYDQLENASWLLGAWENSGDGVTASESWTKADDSTLVGKAVFLVGPDTVQSEEIRLEERLGQLFYIPTVQDQNDGQPVRFSLTSATENELIFENPGHDFPQKISYTLVNPDSIVAVVSGIQESQERSELFPMKRVK